MAHPFKSEFMLLYAVHSCMPMAQRSPYRHLPLWIDSKNQVCKSMSHNIIEAAVDIG